MALSRKQAARGVAGVSGLALLSALGMTSGVAQTLDVTSFNMQGLPGLIDMPSGEVAPDATLSGTVADFGATRRTTLSFQITPKLSGAFRYSSVEGLDVPFYNGSTYYDRSFDLRYQLLEETDTLPSVAVGLQDFLGTGLLEGEYLVATKTFADQFTVTGGIGWGRMGSRDPAFSFGERPQEVLGQGGIPNYDRWFRGDAAPFGGVKWTSKDGRFAVKAEYSSDVYALEEDSGVIDVKSPFNFGVDYRFRNGIQASAYSLYGSEFGLQVTLHTNPRSASVPGGSDAAPLPVQRRSAAALGWPAATQAQKAKAEAELAALLKIEGLNFRGLAIDGNTATLRMMNPTYPQAPQAIGRAARAMTRTMPPQVDSFVILTEVSGMAPSAVTLQRGDLERLEFGTAREMFVAADFAPGAGLMPPVSDGSEVSPFSYAIKPYLTLSVFDPDNPLRADFGLRASASYDIAPGLVLAGAVTKRLTGNLDEITHEEATGLPAVRTDAAQYAREGDPALEYLTLTGYGQPTEDIYTRVSAGYLEPMFAGLSGEALWKPVNSRIAYGAEINYVRQRDFDQRFGLRDYDIVMGHLSAYYDFGNGFHGQLDVGRYLAGDYGATVTIDREFENGWRVGAFATVTNADAEDFGEGSFDKGIRLTLPIGWAIGTATRAKNDVTVQSLTRDGGARLALRDRLYGKVREYHTPELADTWGRFWR